MPPNPRLPCAVFAFALLGPLISADTMAATIAMTRVAEEGDFSQVEIVGSILQYL